MCFVTPQHVPSETKLNQIRARCSTATRYSVFSPYGLQINENCGTCQLRPHGLFCDL